MIRSRPALTLVALLSLAVAACSSGPAAPTNAPGGATAPATSGPGATQPPAGATQPPAVTQDPGGGGTSKLPCEAIQADVAAAVGKALQTSEPAEGSCSYQFGTNAQAPGLDGIVSVRLELPNDTDFTPLKLAFPGGEDVSGLGDAAYWAKSVNVMYAVFKGNIYAVQLVLFDTTTDQKTIAGKVMQALLSRI